jgi:hypothetical protein
MGNGEKIEEEYGKSYLTESKSKNYRKARQTT